MRFQNCIQNIQNENFTWNINWFFNVSIIAHRQIQKLCLNLTLHYQNMEASNETNVNSENTSSYNFAQTKNKQVTTSWKITFYHEMCKYNFSDKLNLKYCLSIHKNKNPFHCEVCRLIFAKKATLRTHIQMHTVKKYQCPIHKHFSSEKTCVDTHWWKTIPL